MTNETFGLVTFTFHYASTLSDLEMLLREEQKFIYIPLCFYFIDNSHDAGLYNALFTFHYASTLSIQSIWKRYWSGLFTFHYASTLSIANATFNGADVDIYIPLCFYFILLSIRYI